MADPKWHNSGVRRKFIFDGTKLPMVAVPILKLQPMV